MLVSGVHLELTLKPFQLPANKMPCVLGRPVPPSHYFLCKTLMVLAQFCEVLWNMKCFPFGKWRQCVYTWESLTCHFRLLQKYAWYCPEKGFIWQCRHVHVYLHASFLQCLPSSNVLFPCLFASIFLSLPLHYFPTLFLICTGVLIVPPPAPQRSRPFDAADRCQRVGIPWDAWAPPRTRAAEGQYTAFVHERNVKNAGMHSGAGTYAVQTTMTSLWDVGLSGAWDCFLAEAGKLHFELSLR